MRMMPWSPRSCAHSSGLSLAWGTKTRLSNPPQETPILKSFSRSTTLTASPVVP